MSLTIDQWQIAERIVGSADSIRLAAATLRQTLAPLHALVLDVSDMKGESPALHLSRADGISRSVYLMATDGHCWTVTQDLERASALVLTQA